MTVDHRLLRWFARHQGEAVKEADIRHALDMSHGTFHQVRARLLAAGLLTREKVGVLYAYTLPPEVAAAFDAAPPKAVAAPKAAAPAPLAGGKALPEADEPLPDLSGVYADWSDVEDAILALSVDVSFSVIEDRLTVESCDGLHEDVYGITNDWNGITLELFTSE